MDGKRKVMISFEKLPEAIRQELKKKYPDGFQVGIKSVTDYKGNTVHVLPYETSDSYYLIKMDNFKGLIAEYLSNQQDQIFR